uniref:Large ribosomal subunit protein uL6m n=1 Tax=Prototheca wickerhamii TaxID=3111 RepID=RM06_PROWI|nr:ribosomal protein L6 [Prototheca wickerhamii]P46748.1 RecName: Full=Large ribosomal subunit protein uL6m; AltName: Full=60S ribosomal protein L6, mitochondrial [Prototheca wickerhamii]AAD12647.1 ribosomal protein L6 [Prototheca wickerhamii]
MKTLSILDTIIKIPEKIEIHPTTTEYIYTITGPLGSSSINLKKLDKNGIACINFDIQNKQVLIRSLYPKYNGLYKKLIENKFLGVSRGFCVYLEIVGVGYRAALLSSSLQNSTKDTNDTIVLKLGHSHDIHYKVPNGVRVFLQSPSEICIFGVDLNQVTQVAHSIRNTRPPSVYKGKGIRYTNEKIVTKTGKRK